MPLALYVHSRKCLDGYLSAKNRGSASKVITVKFFLRDVPCICLAWHWNACFAILLLDGGGNIMPPQQNNLLLLHDWFHTGTARIASLDFFWDVYVHVALAGESSSDSSSVLSVVLTTCIGVLLLFFLTARVIALSDARSVQNRWEAHIHDFMRRNLQRSATDCTEGATATLVPETVAASICKRVVQWSKDARKTFACDALLIEAMGGDLSRRVERHRRAARCLSQLSFLNPWDPYSLYPTGLDMRESWRLRCVLAKSMRSEIYCVPGQAVVEAGRTEMNGLRYLRKGCLEIAEPRGSSSSASDGPSDIQRKISKLKRQIRAGYKARRHHGAKFRKREKKRRNAMLRQIRVLQQKQRWHPPQRRDNAVFSADGSKIAAGQWICWESLALFCNSSDATRSTMTTMKKKKKKEKKQEQEEKGSRRLHSAKTRRAARTLVTVGRHIEILVLPCDVLYHSLVDEFPQVLAALRKISTEEDGGEREREKDMDAKRATHYFSTDEEGGAGSRSDFFSGGDSEHISGDDSDHGEFSPSSSSTSEDGREYYAYKKDYRHLYYKEMKRRAREKRRRKLLEHDMTQRWKKENGNENNNNNDDKDGDDNSDSTGNAQRSRNRAHPETMAGGTPGPSAKFDLPSDQSDAGRATTANPDDRLRAWPRSDAIVRVRLEGSTLAAHLAGRTGTRGEWIEKQGRFVVILDGKSKGRAAMRVRVRGENMVVISPSNKERPVNTPQPLPDVYRVNHRRDIGAIVQVVRDSSNQHHNAPGTPELRVGSLPRSNQGDVMDEQFQQNYSREAIDAEYKRYKSNSAVVPKASEFAQMPSNKPPPSRGMLGTFLEESAGDIGSAKVSYRDGSAEKRREEEQPQPNPSRSPPLKDPLNLFGGMMTGKGIGGSPESFMMVQQEAAADNDGGNSPIIKEKKAEEVVTAAKHQVVEVKEHEQAQQDQDVVIPRETRTLLRALHAFPGLEPGDLPLTKGGLVWGISRQGDWWQGQVYDQRNSASMEGNTGIFPGNYVEVVEKSGGKRRIEGAPVH